MRGGVCSSQELKAHQGHTSRSEQAQHRLRGAGVRALLGLASRGRRRSDQNVLTSARAASGLITA